MLVSVCQGHNLLVEVRRQLKLFILPGPWGSNSHHQVWQPVPYTQPPCFVLTVFFLKTFFFFSYVYEWVQEPMEAIRGYWIPRNQSYRQLWATYVGFRNQNCVLCKIVSVLNHWTLPPAPVLGFHFLILFYSVCQCVQCMCMRTYKCCGPHGVRGQPGRGSPSLPFCLWHCLIATE